MLFFSLRGGGGCSKLLIWLSSQNQPQDYTSMILINSFNIRSLWAILVRHHGFQKILCFDCGVTGVCEVHYVGLLY